VNGGECILAVAIEARRCVRWDHKAQYAAVLRRIVSQCRHAQGKGYRRAHGEKSTHCCLPGRGWLLASSALVFACQPATDTNKMGLMTAEIARLVDAEHGLISRRRDSQISQPGIS
jgi:hypothetical protein